MKRQNDVQLESKPKIQRRTDFLDDLDGLLVNSKNFNKLFVQRTSHEWIKAQVDKLVQSHTHLSRFIEVLTEFIISDNHHPHVIQQVLMWLNFCIQHHSTCMQTSEIQKSLKNLCSYYYEMSGMGNMFLKAANRGSAVENWSNIQNLVSHFPRRFYYSILPKTKFVYIDDENNPTTRKSNAPPSILRASENNEQNLLDMLDDDEFSDIEDTLSSAMKDDSSDYEQESLYHQSIEESDAGVFDVSEPLSSDDDNKDDNDNNNNNTTINDDWIDDEILMSTGSEHDSDIFNNYYDEKEDSDDDDNLSVSTELSSTSIKTNLFPDVIEPLEPASKICNVNNIENKNKQVIESSIKSNESNCSTPTKSPNDRRKSLRSNSKKQ